MSRPQTPKTSPENIAETFQAVIQHFFPFFWQSADKFRDPRLVQGRCLYSPRDILGACLVRNFSNLPSHRALDSQYGDGNAYFLNNFRRFTGTDVGTFPRGETINYFLSALPPDDLAALLDKMCMSLVKQKVLNKCRESLDNSFLLGADGTGLYSTVINIPHSTRRTLKDGKVINCVYALMIAFLSPGGCVIPFHIEFIENKEGYNPEFDKQDCEHKALVKAIADMHLRHPRLSATLLLDALSLDYTIMKCCMDCDYHFVISYKDGDVKGLTRSIQDKLADSSQHKSKVICRREGDKDVRLEYTWCKVSYTFGNAGRKGECGFPVTYIKVIRSETNKKGITTRHEYERITNHSISAVNVVRFFDEMGRTRWCEENQGFNEMKNLGLGIEHACGCTGDAVVNHFRIMMIAFIIMQLAGKTDIYGRILSEQTQGKCAVKASLRTAFDSLRTIGSFFVQQFRSALVYVLGKKFFSRLRVRWMTG